MQMAHSSHGLCHWRAGLLTAAAALTLSGVALATDQSQQRQQGRDANQAAKQNARSDKVDCRAANQQSNAACRHDKRETKQDGRQEKRDIKY
jgi:hypothetical protein